MTIALAQSRPVKGDIQANVESHQHFIVEAAKHEAQVVLFLELSLTGYEPRLAKQLATGIDDRRFDGLQKLSDELNIHVCAGVPVKKDNAVMIGMIIFSPNKRRELYAKQYLHDDELPYFIAGPKDELRFEKENSLALSICYELSVPEHSRQASMNASRTYLSSVAKTKAGVDKAIHTLSGIAGLYRFSVAMVNAVGPCDDFECGGRSSAWNEQGKLIAQLNEDEEGLLIVGDHQLHH